MCPWADRPAPQEAVWVLVRERLPWSPGTRRVWREVSEQRLMSCPGIAGSPQWAGGENTEILLLAWLSGAWLSPGSVLTLWGLQALTVPRGTLSPSSLEGGWESATNVLKLLQPENHFLKVNVILELNIYVASFLFWTVHFHFLVFLSWNENWPFPVLWPLLSFPNLLAYWVQHFHSIIFYNLK